MKREVYVMVDTVSGNFGEPFTMANSAEVRRQFTEVARSGAVPAFAIRDTNILHIGTFNADIENPFIVPVPVPAVVLRGDTLDVEKLREEVDSSAFE